MRKEFQLGSRREFLADTGRHAALLTALASGSVAASGGSPATPGAATSRLSPPTDPKLIAYEQVLGFRPFRADSRRLAVGPDDRVYICAGNHLACWTTDGQSLREFTLAEPVRCVGVAADGTLYVGLRDHVEVLDSAGKLLARWDPASPRSWLTGVVVTAEAVLVCDAGQRAVLRYDRAGKLLLRIGGRDPDRQIPGLSVPSPYLSAVLGQDGLLYVNNFGRHRVEGYTFNGDLETRWGRPSAAIDGFCGCCNPVGLAVLPDGRFVTCEKGLPRVKVYSQDGAFESVVAGTESFAENARACSSPDDCLHGGLDVAVDSRGQVCILDLVTGEVRVMRPKVA